MSSGGLDSSLSGWETSHKASGAEGAVEVLQLHINTLPAAQCPGALCTQRGVLEGLKHVLPLPALQQECPCIPAISACCLKQILEPKDVMRAVTKCQGCACPHCHTELQLPLRRSLLTRVAPLAVSVPLCCSATGTGFIWCLLGPCTKRHRNSRSGDISVALAEVQKSISAPLPAPLLHVPPVHPLLHT